MPKFGAHILVAEAAQKRRPELFHGATNALRLGAVGPDITLFLFDPITNPVVRTGYNAAMTVLKTIDDIKNQLEKIEAVFDGPIEDLEGWVTGNLSKDFSETAELLIEATLLAMKLGMANSFSSFNIQNPLLNAIATGQIRPDLIRNPAHAAPSFLVDSTDNFGFPFRYFGHPLTDDKPWKKPAETGDYSTWWWMDMLHYRNTGAFAKTLIANAYDDVTKNYANGYLSHVAGDICGHPFINGLVGGPFRNHAYRHIVLESLADTLIWSTQNKGDILASSIDEMITVSDVEIEAIADLLISSMRQVYTAPLLPNQLPNRYPDKSDIIGAYNAMRLYLKLSTSSKVGRPKPPPDNPGDLLKELQETLARNNPGNLPNWDPNKTQDSIIAILGYLFRGVIFLLMIATLPQAIMAKFLTAPTSRWLLYLIRLAIFMMVSGLRTLLAFMGWGYAGVDDFDTFGFLTGMVTFNGNDGGYPRSSVKQPKLPYYWMIPPTNEVAPLELELTIVGPMPHGSKLDWILDQNNLYDPVSVTELTGAIGSKETVVAEHRTINAGSAAFGNAPDFCNLMLDGSVNIPDLDLDADRGFGFKPWEETPPNERFV